MVVRGGCWCRCGSGYGLLLFLLLLVGIAVVVVVVLLVIDDDDGGGGCPGERCALPSEARVAVRSRILNGAESAGRVS